MQGAAIIREALSRQGLGGADLEAAVLAYKVANNLPLDTVVDAEAMARRIELFRRVFAAERDHPSQKKIFQDDLPSRPANGAKQARHVIPDDSGPAVIFTIPDGALQFGQVKVFGPQ
jgi:hypothetical protein